jgi:hypothetical protein
MIRESRLRMRRRPGGFVPIDRRISRRSDSGEEVTVLVPVPLSPRLRQYTRDFDLAADSEDGCFVVCASRWLAHALAPPDKMHEDGRSVQRFLFIFR